MIKLYLKLMQQIPFSMWYHLFWWLMSLAPMFILSNVFQSVDVRRPRRNKFDLSHEKKFSCNMGELIPVMLQEMVPGDSFRVRSEAFLRLAPLLAPIMHRVDVYMHSFYVPNRILWTEFEDFITGGEDGLQEPAFPQVQISTITAGFFAEGKLPDYLGLPSVDPVTITDPVNVSALPFRAYQAIYNEYYRDQNLTPEVDFDKGSGTMDPTETQLLTTLRKRAWRKDYFTSALPWSQRGDEVEVPVNWSPTYNSISTFTGVGNVPSGEERLQVDSDGSPGPFNIEANSTGEVPGRIENLVDPQTDIGLTVSAFRRAIKLQEWLELAARGGSRYIEQMKMFFGVTSSDARLQRPEYLGGGIQRVNISEVLSTFDDQASSNPQGTMTGHGVSAGNTNGFTYFAEEHGYLMTIMSVLPKTAYQQGIPRHWRREDKFDFYWEQFAHIGEQEIKRSEIYYDGAFPSGTKDATFGYAPRYSEYKYEPDTVHGDFRSTLAYWHMGRIFASSPALNTSFVESDPTFRVFAVDDPDVDHLWCQVYHHISALRPMPYFGTPKLV